MMGAAALVFGFAAVSCSSDDGVYNPNAQSDLIVANYKKAFVNVFGQPAANQTWGFGTATRATRAHSDGRIDVNGNEWQSYPLVTAAEARAVFDYVNRVKTTIPHYSEVAPTDLSTYYVTQVWGKENTVESDVSDERTYPNFDQKRNGQPGNVFGPEHMDELQIAMSGEVSINDKGELVGDWVHINNFNASNNTNYGGNTGVINGGTLDFAYHNSEDSKYHNKWIIIDGQYITDSEGVNHAGKYYVCFDFYACKNDVYTNFQKPGTGNVEVPGAYATVADAIAAGAKDRNGNLVQSNWSIGNVVGGNMCVPANEIYTDWIVRIVNAAPAPEEPSLRVMAEDLSANEASDFDFNDVVFDVTRIDATHAQITLQAAGGTLPLRINKSAMASISSDYEPSDNDSWEVHVLFNVDTDMMVNTKAQEKHLKGTDKPAVTKDAQNNDLIVTGNFPANQDDFASAVKNIRVWVFKADKWMELTAEVGQAACKFGVPTDLHWAWERTNVNSAFNFGAWVQDPSTPLIPAQQ